VTTLIKRAENLEEMLLTRGRKKAGVALMGRLAEVQSKAESAALQFESLALFREEFDRNGMQVPELSKATISAIKKIQTSFRRIATDLKKEDASEQELIQVMERRAFNEAVLEISRIQSDLRKAIAIAITEFRTGLLPTSLSEQVPDVPGKPGVVRRLNDCRDRLNATVLITVDRADPTFKDLASILNGFRADIAFWERELPDVLEAFALQAPELQAFISAVGTPSGASLEMITPELLAKLRELEVISQYRVRSL
jgi:hypothetical protein